MIDISHCARLSSFSFSHFLKILFSICVGLLVYLCTMYMSCTQRQAEGVGSPGSGVSNNCESLFRCWELSLGPLEEQHALSITQPILCPFSLFISPFIMFVCVNRTVKLISVLLTCSTFWHFSILNYKILVALGFISLSSITAGGCMCCYSSIKSSLCSLSMNTNILTAFCSVQLSCWCLSEEIHSRIKEMSVFFFFHYYVFWNYLTYVIHIIC